MDSQTKRTGDLLDLVAASRLIGFIGAGKLAGSVIRGLVLAKFCSPGEIIASEPNESLRAALRYEVGIHVTENNAELVGQAVGQARLRDAALRRLARVGVRRVGLAARRPDGAGCRNRAGSGSCEESPATRRIRAGHHALPPFVATRA